MNDSSKKKIDQDLKAFTTRNFTHPTECRNLEQIRFYIHELCSKIQELERRFDYVPGWAYQLLSQYKAKQNALVLRDFRNTYQR